MDADEEYRKSRLTKNMCVYACEHVQKYITDDEDYEILRHPH
jgi:hypothetical protein